VSQNISIFCAAAGMAATLRASTDKDKAQSLLKFKDTQFPSRDHPIGHPK
jgi:hypothetical protein